MADHRIIALPKDSAHLPLRFGALVETLRRATPDGREAGKCLFRSEFYASTQLSGCATRQYQFERKERGMITTDDILAIAKASHLRELSAAYPSIGRSQLSLSQYFFKLAARYQKIEHNTEEREMFFSRAVQEGELSVQEKNRLIDVCEMERPGPDAKLYGAKHTGRLEDGQLFLR